MALHRIQLIINTQYADLYTTYDTDYMLNVKSIKEL